MREERRTYGVEVLGEEVEDGGRDRDGEAQEDPEGEVSSDAVAGQSIVGEGLVQVVGSLSHRDDVGGLEEHTKKKNANSQSTKAAQQTEKRGRRKKGRKSEKSEQSNDSHQKSDIDQNTSPVGHGCLIESSARRQANAKRKGD